MEIDLDVLEATLRGDLGALDRATMLALVTEVRTLRASVAQLEDDYFNVSLAANNLYAAVEVREEREDALRATLSRVRAACTCGAATAGSDAP